LVYFLFLSRGLFALNRCKSGAISTINAVALLAGTPTSGVFIQTVDQKHFNRLIVFCGIFNFMGSFMIGLVRFFGHSQSAGQVASSIINM